MESFGSGPHDPTSTFGRHTHHENRIVWGRGPEYENYIDAPPLKLAILVRRLEDAGTTDGELEGDAQVILTPSHLASIRFASDSKEMRGRLIHDAKVAQLLV